MSDFDGRTSGYKDTEVDDLGYLSIRTSMHDKSVSSRSIRYVWTEI